MHQYRGKPLVNMPKSRVEPASTLVNCGRSQQTGRPCRFYVCIQYMLYTYFWFALGLPFSTSLPSTVIRDAALVDVRPPFLFSILFRGDMLFLLAATLGMGQGRPPMLRVNSNFGNTR